MAININECTEMLKQMFRDNQLTQSTITAVVTEKKGDLDLCVDTILDLLNDPAQIARQAQMEEAQRDLERARQEQEKRLKELEQKIAKPNAKQSPASSNNSNSSNSNNSSKNSSNANSANNNSSKAGAQTSSSSSSSGAAAKSASSSTSSAASPAKPAASKHDDDDDDDDDDDNVSAIENRMLALEEKARAPKGGKREKKLKQQHEAQLKYAQAMQLKKDFEERAAQEAAEYAALKAKMDADLRARLAQEVSALRATHNQDFQTRVEQEVAKRLVDIEKKARERTEAERAERAARAEQEAKLTASAAAAAAAAAPTTVVELELSAAHAMPGDKVAVTYRFKKGTPTKSDWIGFYKGTRPVDSNKYYTQSYTDGQPTGRLEFVIPNKLGICEFRFFQSGNYVLVARSTTLHVGPRVSLTARVEGLSVVVRRQQVSGTPSSWDWVALYPVAETDCAKMLDQHKYLSAETDATTILKLPKTPGVYNVRFFASGSGYSPLAVSNQLVVDDNDHVTVTQVGDNKLSVTCDISSLEPEARNWIAVFALGSDNHSYVGSYAYMPSWKTPVLLDAPKEAGEYEVRLLKRGSYTAVKSSSSFKVDNLISDSKQ